MSSLVYDTVITHLPSKRKTTPSGWTSFNAPCCHHNGTTQDSRQRGGLIKNQTQDGVSYHCFNCGFKASWQTGRKLSGKMKLLLQWLGASDDTITKLALAVLQFNETQGFQQTIVELPKFVDKPLPDGAQPIDENTPDNILQYMKSRQLNVDDYDFHWTPKLGYKDRLIMPFYHKEYNSERRIVGWTARKINEGSPKYMSEQQPGYVFNLDAQNWQRIFCIVVEGPFDAIGVDGIALLGSEVKDQQALAINALNKKVILVPDRDDNGHKLMEQAIELGWSVSMPDWSDDVKDVNDAVIKYGRMYTLHTLVSSTEDSELKIKLRSKKWFG
jgi:hypothetical protein|tara:strand:- start:4 stop:990 length:987 start_codon:yes stop_codon:yes gene_type:complete